MTEENGKVFIESVVQAAFDSQDMEIERLTEENERLRKALTRAHMKLHAYVGACKDDTELTKTVLPMVEAALGTLRSDFQT